MGGVTDPAREAAECPDEDAFVRFGEGALVAGERARFVEHVSACPACCALLASVARAPGDDEGERAPPSSIAGSMLGRYRLVRVLGAGAMGVVYVAYDPELDRDVALKLLLPRSGGGERLRREAQTMARLSHPNVVGVHDVGAMGERVFFAMDLVEGETLERWLRTRRGWREIVEAMMQAGKGLAAMHEAGVVHGDFKPENVLVSGDGRVRVTDFGLAARHDDDPGSRAGGTPAYMAPERDVSPRADVFAFAVTLHRAVYGVLPFHGSIAAVRASIAAGRRTAAARRAGVPRWIAGVVTRGLAVDPADRWPSMAAMLEALDPAPRDRKRRRWSAIALGTGAALSMAAIAVVLHARTTRGAAATAPAVRPIALVLASDGAPLTAACAELVAADISSGDRVLLVSNRQAARMARDLDLGSTLTPEALARIRGYSGATRVVRVSTQPPTPEAIVVVSVVDALSGRPVGEGRARGTGDDPAVLVARALDGARGAIDAGGAETLDELRAELPPPGDALASYVDGLARIDRYDIPGARAALESSLRAAPHHARAHVALAEVLDRLGLRDEASEHARAALEGSASLSPASRRQVEELARVSSGEFDRAETLVRSRWAAHRDDVDGALALVKLLQRSRARVKEAQATLDAARAAPHDPSFDARIDLAEANLESLVGDNAREMEAAIRAASKADARGDATTLAWARYRHAEALLISNQYREADTQAAQAVASFRAIGDAEGLTRSLLYRGAIATERGDLDAARAIFDDTLAAARASGIRGLEGTALMALAGFQERQQDFEAALASIESSVSISRELGSSRTLGPGLKNEGTVLIDLGRLDRAREVLTEALALRRASGEKLGIGESQIELARAMRLSGDTAGAEAMLNEAIAVYDEAGGVAVEPRSELAMLLLDANRPREAEQAARTALAAAGEQQDKAVVARALLARAVAEQLLAGQAREELAQAETAVEGTKGVEARAVALLQIARAHMAMRTAADLVAARLAVRALRDGARPSMGVALDARLAAAELDHDEAARAAVAADARAHGFGAIASRASSSRAGLH